MVGRASAIWAAYFRMARKGRDQQAGQKGGAYYLCYQHGGGGDFYTMAVGVDCGGRDIDQRDMVDDAAGGLSHLLAQEDAMSDMMASGDDGQILML